MPFVPFSDPITLTKRSAVPAEGSCSVAKAGFMPPSGAVLAIT